MKEISYDTVSDRCRQSTLGRPADIDRPHYIFIGGSARTGTTLLQSIICADSNVNPLLPEAAPVRHILKAHQQIRQHTQKFPGIYFGDDEHLNSYFSTVLLSFLEKVKNRHACTYLALKEPALTPFFALIDELLSQQACYLCLVRDPRDTIASMLRWGKKLTSQDRNHIFKVRDIEHLSSFYMHYYAFLLSANESFFRRLLLIKYEDLVNHPHQVLKKIKTFSGLELKGFSPDAPWDNSLLDYKDGEGPIGPAVSKLYGQPITSQSVGSYRDILTLEEDTAIQVCCREIFELFDYPMDHSILPDESKSDFWKKAPVFDENHELMRLRARARQHDEVLAGLNEIRGKAKQYDRLAADLPQYKSKVKAYEKLIEDLPGLRSKAKEYDKLTNELPGLRSKAKEYDKLAEELPRLRSKAKQYEMLIEELPGIKSKAKEYDKVVDDLPVLKSKARKHDKLVEEISELRSAAGQYDKLVDELEGLVSKGQKLDKIVKEAINLRSRADQYDKIADQLPRLKSKARQYEKITAELPSLRSKAKQYEKLFHELPSLRSKAKQYTKLADELPRLRSQAKKYDELSKEVLHLRSKAKQLEKLMQEVPKLRYKARRLDELLNDQD
jgi:uncharacterized coiled-coil DUF342 family protein